MAKKGFGRRTFIKTAAATSGVAGLMALNSKLDLNLFKDSKAYAAGKVEERVGFCGICGMECAFTGKVVDGKLVKLEGNPEDLQSGGSLCAKGNSGINMLYDPDRLKYPMVRTNPKKGIGEDPKWKRISWEEAFALAAEKLNGIRQEHGGKSIIWIGKHKGKDLLKAIGSPNDLCHHSTCDTVRDVATETTIGVGSYIPDVRESDYILSFGWDQFGKAKNAWARGLSYNLGRGKGKLVVFDPRLSPTASKAHRWIPVRPGTDHAVALAMINVIISENLYDADFVSKYTVGFDQLVSRVAPYTPEWAEKISDVPADVIREVAREFANAPSAVIPMHKREAIQVRECGFSQARAMHILMAITGNYEKRGGAILPRKASFGKVSPKATAPALETTERIDGADKYPVLLPKPLGGEGIYQTIPDALLDGKPYQAKAAIVYAQGLYSMSDPVKFAQGLSKLDFVINVNIYPDEMATLADLVLPECTYMETAGLSSRNFYAIYTQIAAKEPMVDTLYEAKSRGAIMKGLMGAMGLADYLTPGGKPVLDVELAPYNITYDQILKMGGVYTPEKVFKPKDLTKLKTESGKIEIYSEELAKDGYDPLPTHKDEWVIKPQKANEFYFATTRYATHRHASTQNMRWVHEINPENAVQMNKTSAAKLGIKNGDLVEVTSPTGKVQIKAYVTAGIRPDTICVPHGYGHWSKFMTLASGKGANDGDLMPLTNFEETYKMRVDNPAASAHDCHFIATVKRL